MVAAAVGLITMAVQSSEASYWNWMLDQPESCKTLSAIYHLVPTGSYRGRSPSRSSCESSTRYIDRGMGRSSKTAQGLSI